MYSCIQFRKTGNEHNVQVDEKEAFEFADLKIKFAFEKIIVNNEKFIKSY